MMHFIEAIVTRKGQVCSILLLELYYGKLLLQKLWWELVLPSAIICHTC